MFGSICSYMIFLNVICLLHLRHCNRKYRKFIKLIDIFTKNFCYTRYSKISRNKNNNTDRRSVAEP